MPLPLQSLRSIAERPHWTVTNGQATFSPVHAGWRATVKGLHRPPGDDRYHVALIDRSGAVRFTMEAASLDDAIRKAERGVLARNALRLVPRTGPR
jgi:hypothetical protein